MSGNDLATLPEAIEWLRGHWEGRPIPMRLHDRDTEGAGGLRFSGAFLAYLQARPFDATTTEETDVCHHPRLAADAISRACPDCWGAGTRKFARTRFRYPMWAALKQLETHKAVRPGHPSPIECIGLLLLSNFEARRAALLTELSWDTAEPLFLMAIRKLHGRYRTGPVANRSWVDKSDSQRAAETVAAIA